MTQGIRTNSKGFTLIELMVSMTIATIITSGIITFFIGQQNIRIAQNQAVSMQQNLRAAVLIMTDDIRMAGYDPLKTGDLGITQAGSGLYDADDTDANGLFFTYYNPDAAGDGNNNDDDSTTADADETLQSIKYFLYDSNSDGTIDLGRRSGARLDAIASNIQSLTFEYQDKDGEVMYINDDGNFVYRDIAGEPAAAYKDIKAISITLMAVIDPNERSYVDAANNTRTLTTTIRCRNMGL